MNCRALAIGLLIFSCTISIAQEENGTNEVYESKVLFTLPGVEAKSMYSNPSLDTFFIHSQDTLYTVTRDGTVISKDSSDIIYGCFEGENMYYLIKGEPIITGKISMKYYPAIIINQFGDTIVNFHNILKYNSSSNLNRTDSLTSRDYSFLGINKDIILPRIRPVVVLLS